MTPAFKTWDAPSQQDDLNSWQRDRCAMCGRDCSRTRLVADHCHEIGLVRGLLCGSCNSTEAYSDEAEWEAWRSGDNAASRCRDFYVYTGWGAGRGALSEWSNLAYYSRAERDSWWAKTIADLLDGAEWPAKAPLSAEQERRKSAEQEQMSQLVANAMRGLMPTSDQ